MKRLVAFSLFLLSVSPGCGDDDDFRGVEGLEITASECQDNADNDSDGKADCDDAECQGFFFCADIGDVDLGTSSEETTDTANDTDNNETNTDSDSELTPNCLEGLYEIKNSLDATLLKHYSCIIGDLKVNAPGLSTLYLPNLQTISGSLLIGQKTDPSQPTQPVEIPNTNLVSMNLSALTSIGRDLAITRTVVLTSLNGLEKLTTVGGDLEISSNAALTSLNGLNSLNSVGGYLLISNNTVLTSISGIEGLAAVGGEFVSVSHNLALPNCKICPLLEKLSSGQTSISVSNNLTDSCGSNSPLTCP